MQFLEANHTLKENHEIPVKKETQYKERRTFMGRAKAFITGIKDLFILIFVPRKHLPQTKADTDTLVHTYTMFVHALATAAWYIVGFSLWLMAIVRLIPNAELHDGAVGGWRDLYLLFYRMDAVEVWILCLPIGFAFLGVGGIFRLVSDSLTQSKDMVKNSRIMALDVAIITAFIAFVTKYIV